MWPKVRRRFSKAKLRIWFVAGVLAAGAAPAQEKDDDLAAVSFSIIATAQNNGFYDKAAPRWEEFIQKHPNYKRIDEANYYLGICQLHLKKYDQAIKTFQGVGQKFPQFTNLDGVRYNIGLARYHLAKASGKPEDYKTAAGDFADLIAKTPNTPHASRALYLQAESLYAAGDTASSVKAYQELIAKHPDSALAASAYYYLGVTQQEDLKQFADAAKTFDEFLKKPAYKQHELAGEIRLRQGVCLFELKDYAGAEQQFAEVAKEKEGAFADFAMLRQGQCRLEQGKQEEAAQLFGELAKAFPESTHRAAAQVAAGKCYFEIGKFDDAKNGLTAALNIPQAQPTEKAEAAYWLGRTHLKQDKPQDALNLLEPATGQYADGPWGPYLFIARADALYDIPQRRADSIKGYNDFLQKYPQHELAAQARYMSALTSLAEKQYDQATLQAEAFLTSGNFNEHPLRPAVLFIAAECQMRGGDNNDEARRQKAEGYYRQLIEKYPQHQDAPRAALGVGWCLLDAKKPEEAIKFVSGNYDALKQPEQQAEAQMLIGRAHARLDRASEALAAFDLANQAAPNWPQGDHLLFESAQALRKLDRQDEARGRLEQLIAKFGASDLRAEATYQLGELAHAQQKYDEAIARFGQVAAQFGDSEFGPPARYGQAAAYFAKKENDKALAALDGLLAAASDDALRASGHYLRGLVRQELQQFDAAAQDLTAFVNLNPPENEALDARYALALCQAGAKKNAEAAATLRELIKTKPDYNRVDQARYELGHALLNQDKNEEAAAAFAELAKLHPDCPLAAEAMFHVGRWHEDSADGAEDKAVKAAELKAAAEAFAAGLATATKPALREKLQYKLGDMQFQQEQFATAAQTLAAQLQEFPQGELAGFARYLAAESLFRESKFAEALPLYEKVAADKIEKYHADALYRAGACAGGLKNWPVCQNHYQAILTEFPKYVQIADARYGLAFALQNQNQLDEAEKLYEQVTQETISETAAKARFMVGEIAFARKQYEDAIFHYGGVTGGYNFPHWKGMARLEMSRCYKELGQNEKAAAELEKLIEEDPQHERAEDAKKLLADLKK